MNKCVCIYIYIISGGDQGYQQAGREEGRLRVQEPAPGRQDPAGAAPPQHTAGVRHTRDEQQLLRHNRAVLRRRPD